MRPWLQKSASIQLRTNRPAVVDSSVRGVVYEPKMLTAQTAAQPRHITLSRARSRLDRSRFLQPRPHFAAFFEIYKKIIFSRAHFVKFWQILQKNSELNFFKNLKILPKFCQNFAKILQNLLARRVVSCRSRKMQQNEALVAKIGFDPAENEPWKE